MSVKNKATGTPQRMYCIHAHDIAMRIFVRSGIRLPHTYIYVGLSALYIERRYFLFVTYLIISRYRKTQT